MPAKTEEIEKFRTLFLGKNASIQNFQKARDMVYASPTVRTEFSKILSALKSGKDIKLRKRDVPKRLGIGLWVAGHLEEAEKKLSKFTDAVSRYFAAQCLLSSNKPAEARSMLEKIPVKNRPPCAEAAIGRTLRLEGKAIEGADYIRRPIDKHANSAELHYELGMCRYESGEYEAAAEAFDEALHLDPDHRGAMFNLAYLLYQRGADKEAVELYEKCAVMRPVHIGAVANLALIYEDMGKYDESTFWFQKLHDAEPSDEKLEMFAKFASSCTNMYYDDEHQRQVVRHEKLLAMLIDDFELSIRSRKCLEDMDIKTLGDLVSKTESELLSFNNFGETSLSEVKSILKQKGLILKEETPTGGEAPDLTGDGISKNEALDLSLEEAGLSTRVRKCLEGCKIKTLKDVCGKKEKALLEIRDFGRASLRELKKRLVYYELSLKEE